MERPLDEPALSREVEQQMETDMEDDREVTNRYFDLTKPWEAPRTLAVRTTGEAQKDACTSNQEDLEEQSQQSSSHMDKVKPPKPRVHNNNKYYTVEAILLARVCKNKKQYLVQWVGKCGYKAYNGKNFTNHACKHKRTAKTNSKL